jgi:hypothetical protein
VRTRAGISFEGDKYPQHFVLGDVEVDGLDRLDAIHSFAGKEGIAMFFPLGRPTTWRVIAMQADAGKTARDGASADELSIEELQAIVDPPTGGSLRLHDPAWLTHFRLHHRQAVHYRAGRVFLAGDAAHIHSPAGAQGMNTGIQDAWNLGWKLALVAQGLAVERLLDSYEAERWPVGRFLLRFTDRLFSVITRVNSAGALLAWVRRTVVAPLLPRILSLSRFRAFAFRIVSQLDIRYRESPAVIEGTPKLRAGPKAGDRLPDARLARNQVNTYLQDELAGPRFHLLLCGGLADWNSDQVTELTERYARLLAIDYLSRTAIPGVLTDESGQVHTMLGIDNSAQYLVRPDGHVGFRCAGSDLRAVTRYLERWFVSTDGRSKEIQPPKSELR